MPFVVKIFCLFSKPSLIRKQCKTIHDQVLARVDVWSMTVLLLFLDQTSEQVTTREDFHLEPHPAAESKSFKKAKGQNRLEIKFFLISSKEQQQERTQCEIGPQARNQIARKKGQLSHSSKL